MSFTDQKPFTVMAEHLSARWGAYKDARLFRCAWCGHRFQAGDVARWVYTNGEDGRGIAGNPFICAACDGPRSEILARLRSTLAEFTADRFWWFRQYSTEAREAVNEAIRDEQHAAREAYDQGRDDGRRDAQDW